MESFLLDSGSRGDKTMHYGQDLAVNDEVRSRFDVVGVDDSNHHFRLST